MSFFVVLPLATLRLLSGSPWLFCLCNLAGAFFYSEKVRLA